MIRFYPDGTAALFLPGDHPVDNLSGRTGVRTIRLDKTQTRELLWRSMTHIREGIAEQAGGDDG